MRKFWRGLAEAHNAMNVFQKSRNRMGPRTTFYGPPRAPQDILPAAREEDKPQEECGVFGVFSSRENAHVSEMLFFGLQALQHRGQESCGMALAHGENSITVHKDMGLVQSVFSSGDLLSSLSGDLGIGHVRYTTVGSSGLPGAQPLYGETSAGPVAIAHNGTISNAGVLREFLEDAGDTFASDADSELIVSLIRRKAKHGIPKAVGRALSMLQGSYSMVVLSRDAVMGVKDPYGIRPLCVGRTDAGDYVFASESCALDAVGAKYIREVEAGEILSADKNGLHSHKFSEQSQSFPCSFEQIYFSRPDSMLGGATVYNTRHEMGRLLYLQDPVEADIVIGVPDSGMPAAAGFSEASNIPLEMGLVKNRYISRSFINPTQAMREQTVRAKFNVVADIVSGKRVVMVDDSLVRGTTSTILVQMLRDAGAREVHFRSASPAVRFLCYFGIDISKRKELAANNMSEAEVGKLIGADSLAFLSMENLRKSLHSIPHCMGCFSGVYPTYAPADGTA